MILHPDVTIRLFWSSDSLNELKQEITRRTSLTDFRIEYYEPNFQEFIDLERISQLKQTAKLKLEPLAKGMEKLVQKGLKLAVQLIDHLDV